MPAPAPMIADRAAAATTTPVRRRGRVVTAGWTMVAVPPPYDWPG